MNKEGTPGFVGDLYLDKHKSLIFHMFNKSGINSPDIWQFKHFEHGQRKLSVKIKRIFSMKKKSSTKEAKEAKPSKHLVMVKDL